MFNVDFPKDTDSVKFRAVQWICTEVLLALAALLNFLPREFNLITHGLLQSDSVLSSLLQECIPHFRCIRDAGLLVESHLASYRNC